MNSTVKSSVKGAVESAPQTRGQRFFSALARLSARAFFRRLEVVGQERIPRHGPVLLVANHVNSLVDAVLLAAAAPRMPRLLGKSTLWKVTALRPLLRMAQVIPVYRQQDGVDTSRNEETFSASHEALRDGGLIALFPEGISHSEPELQPLKSGAARIALGAEERFGPLGVTLVPVGLTFDAKHRFRSRALVQVGEPIPVLDTVERLRPAGEALLEREGGQDSADEIPLVIRDARRLTEVLYQALRDVTVNYDSWEQGHLLEHAVRLWSQPEGGATSGTPLAQRTALLRAFARGHRDLAAAEPQRVEDTTEAVREYDQLLDACGLRDHQVGARYPRLTMARYLVYTAFTALLRLPAAVVGTVLNWPTYRFVGFLARRLAAKIDVQSTYKLFASMILFPLTWVAEAVAAGLYAGWVSALAVLLLAPASGWVALRFHEQRGRFLNEARAFLQLFTAKRQRHELLRRRRQIHQQVEALVERWRELEGEAAARSAGT